MPSVNNRQESLVLIDQASQKQKKGQPRRRRRQKQQAQQSDGSRSIEIQKNSSLRPAMPGFRAAAVAHPQPFLALEVHESAQKGKEIPKLTWTCSLRSFRHVDG